MSPQGELRLVTKVTKNKPFQKISKVLNALDHAGRSVLRRRVEQTDLKLEHELFMCEARRCKKILSSM